MIQRLQKDLKGKEQVNFPIVILHVDCEHSPAVSHMSSLAQQRVTLWYASLHLCSANECIFISYLITFVRSLTFLYMKLERFVTTF